MINRKVVGVWMLALIEAIVYASIPATVAYAVEHGQYQLFLVLLLSVLGICLVASRAALDTRVYGSMLKDKILEFAAIDKGSARAKAERWGTALTSVEHMGPAALRGTTDCTAAIMFLTSESVGCCLIMLVGALPYIAVTFWAAKQMKQISQEKNELAEKEAMCYDSEQMANLKWYYEEKYYLQVKESDVDAKALSLGIGIMYVAKIATVSYALHTGASPAVAIAVFMYGERFSTAIDRLSLVAQNVSASLVAAKI